MYQGRREDFNPKVDKVLEEGPKIQEAFEEIEEKLRAHYNAKDNSTLEIRLFIHYSYKTHILPSNLPDNWDYTKEFGETLDNLNKSIVDAYITFLEAEREALIQRWNKMAKDLK